MSYLRFLFVLSILIISALQGHGREIVLSAENPDYLLEGTNMSFFIDSNSSMGFEEVKEQDFRVNKASFRKIEDTSVVYWIRFKFANEASLERKWVLEIISPHTEHIDFYIPRKGSYVHKKTGMKLPFEQREYQHKNFVFDFLEGADLDEYYYLKIKSSNKVGFLFKVRSQHWFTQYSLNEYVLLGIYYGIILIMIFYNALLYSASREWLYLFLTIYIASTGLISLSDDGLGFQYLWPSQPDWNQFMGLHLFPLMLLGSYILYALHFIDYFKISKKIAKMIIGVTLLYVAYDIVRIVFVDYITYFSQWYVLPFLAVYCSYVYLYFFRKYTPARLFLIGNTFAIIGITIHQLRLLEVLPGNVFTVYAFDTGMILEIVMLSLALGDRYRSQKKAIERAQQEQIKQLEVNEQLQTKVNRELEEKVQERTVELNETNEKLQLLIEEANKMNLQLDVDNWKLRKNIEAEQTARALNKALTFEEFKKLYPTNNFCLKHLEKLKWGSGYECKKCGNEKYSVQKESLKRKCSKCGHLESVTAATLYHGSKIPLNKLFYLTYIFSTGRKTKLETLEKELGVSKTSLSNLSKKIKDRMKEVRMKAEEDADWQKLIVD